MSTAGELPEYVVPRYRAAEDEPWFHFLHGNVPGHQIDFMYRPEVPQGPLCQQHYSHLARLMSYIEPHGSAGYAFAIGNLSRDDTQHEPGHGGVALILGLRVQGTTDGAGRPDPPFAHAIATIDRALGAPALFDTARAFHRRVLGDAASAEWYRSYVRSAAEAPSETEGVLARYVASFDDLPRPGRSALSLAWTTGGATQAGRVVFVHPDDAPFEVLAGAAARLAAVLYRSDVRWSAISSGREADVPNGLTVRFLPESAVGRDDAPAALHKLEEIPEDEAAIARELFGARPVRARLTVPGWRDRPAVCDHAPISSERDIPITVEAPAPAPAARDAGAEEQEPTATPAGEPGAGEGRATPDAVTTDGAASEPVPEVEVETPALVEAPAAAPERPAAMVPIPVPLPLVEPPPLTEPAPRSEPRPGAGRSRKLAVAVAGCFVAGVVAVLYGIPGRDPAALPPPAPAAVEVASPPAPADNAATAAAPTAALAPPAPEPVVVASPSPSSRATPVVKPSAGRTAPPSGRRGCVLLGRPCF